MSAALAFLAVTAVLGSVLRLRAALRPERYDAPVWYYRARLAWRAYRGAHGHYPLAYRGRPHGAAVPPRRTIPCAAAGRSGATGPGGRVPVVRLTHPGGMRIRPHAAEPAPGERW